MTKQVPIAPTEFGSMIRERISSGKILPLIGVYDVFSASLASRRFEAVFCSGYGFAASYYGLPDEGFIAWPDMVSYVERMRAVLPQTHIVVDIDDGYGDPNLATNVALRLERVGASAVILEDQRRPKKCGHLPGKEILPLDEYMVRLERVLEARRKLFVIARTDTVDPDDALHRAGVFAKAGADGILVEGIRDLKLIPEIRKVIGPDKALTVNLIAGGKTPPVTTTELEKLGASLIVYSTPCLFAAHEAIEKNFDDFIARDGELIPGGGGVDLMTNNDVLKDNLGGAVGTQGS